MLSKEKDFFDSDVRDKLKVPPFTKVKRIPRDYVHEEKMVLKYKQQRELEQAKNITSASSLPEPAAPALHVNTQGSFSKLPASL